MFLTADQKNRSKWLIKAVIKLAVALLIMQPSGVVSYAALPPSTLKADDIPDYTGDPYTIIADNNPGFGTTDVVEVEKDYVLFGELDTLGRTTGASACLGSQMSPDGSRGSIGLEIRPSGFSLVKYPDLIDGPSYLYNRCHLIGYQLCGDPGSPENLFTGTRYLNTTGMLPFENQVAHYLHQTGGHVLYRVTPVYSGNDLVAKGVQMEAFSVEDHGESVEYNVFVYNVQPGVLIDYATGESREDSDYAIPFANSELLVLDAAEGNGSADKVTRSVPIETNLADASYILNTNTKRFHYLFCKSIEDMKEKNKQIFYGTRDEAIESGYIPCGICKP